MKKIGYGKNLFHPDIGSCYKELLCHLRGSVISYLKYNYSFCIAIPLLMGYFEKTK